MSIKINTVEDHRKGEFYVDANLSGIRARFESMVDCQKWMNWMKKTGDIGQLFVELREIVITAKQQIVYESCYAI